MSLQDLKQSRIILIVSNPYGQNKLSALISIPDLPDPVRYSYRVVGKTPEVDFTYEGDDTYAQYLRIPVVGLYAEYVNTVEVTLTTMDGESIMLPFQINMVGQNMGDAPLTIDIEVYDQEMTNATLGQGWLITSFGNAYDKNGDIRICGFFPWIHGNLKVYNDSMYQGSIIPWPFATQIVKANLLGQIRQRYTAPEGYIFHHDVACDTRGNLYILGGTTAEPTDENKVLAHIFKYDDSTGEHLWSRDYSPEFMRIQVLANEDINDVHFNTLEYVESVNQIIVSGRGSNLVFGIDADSGDIQWIIANPEYATVPSPYNLTVINPDSFVYCNGQHTPFLTTNKAFSNAWGEKRFPISVFDNRSCFKEDGVTFNMKWMEDPKDPDYFAADLSPLCYVYGIDLNNNTVEMLYKHDFVGERTEFAGSVFEIGEYYCANINSSRTLYVFDTNNNTGFKASGLDILADTYRSRILTFDELRSLI